MKAQGRLSQLSTLAVILMIIAAFSMLAYPTYAAGGVYKSVNATNLGGSTTCVLSFVASAGEVILTNYYVKVTSMVAGTSITVSSISDGGSDVFKKVGGSATYNNVTVFIGQYTGAPVTTLTITITYSSSVVNECIGNLITGLSSMTADNVVTAHNTATANNIAAAIISTTLTANDVCFADWGFDAAAGSPSATTDSALSADFIYNTRLGGATGRYALGEMFTDSWPSSTADTAAWTQTKTGATTMRYDGIVSCFPTVKTTVTSTTSTTTTTPTTTTTTTTTTSTPATTSSTTTTLTSWSPTVTTSTTTTTTSTTQTTTSTTTTLTSWSPTVTTSTTTTTTSTSITPTTTTTSTTTTSTSITSTNTLTTTSTTTSTTTAATVTTTSLTIANIVIRKVATCLTCSTLTMDVPGLLSGYQLAVFVVGHQNSGASPSFDSLASNRTGDNFQRVTSSASPDGLSETMLFITNATSTNVLHLTATWFTAQKNATILFYAFDPPLPTGPLLHALGVYQTAGIGSLTAAGIVVAAIAAAGFLFIAARRRVKEDEA